jgi:hypothetical protein
LTAGGAECGWRPPQRLSAIFARLAVNRNPVMHDRVFIRFFAAGNFAVFLAYPAKMSVPV